MTALIFWSIYAFGAIFTAFLAGMILGPFDELDDSVGLMVLMAFWPAVWAIGLLVLGGTIVKMIANCGALLMNCLRR